MAATPMSAGEAPDGYHYELLAPGTAGELETLARDPFPEPLPGIIDLAPENPVAPHIVPRHTPEEVEEWFALQTAAQQVAGRRLLRKNGVLYAPKDKNAESDSEPIRVALSPEEMKSFSDEEQQALLREWGMDAVREKPYGKGMGVQPTPEEIERAEAHLRFHSSVFNPGNKRRDD